jgi:hypothetical protein
MLRSVTVGACRHLSSGMETQLVNGISSVPEKEVFKMPFEQ